jgi:hypothetical protein
MKEAVENGRVNEPRERNKTMKKRAREENTQHFIFLSRNVPHNTHQIAPHW